MNASPLVPKHPLTITLLFPVAVAVAYLMLFFFYCLLYNVYCIMRVVVIALSIVDFTPIMFSLGVLFYCSVLYMVLIATMFNLKKKRV